jgi:hypothetical protein
MDWTRSETLALASHFCVHCNGLGLRGGDKTAAEPCNCVLRAIFRACYGRFKECLLRERYMSKVTLDDVQGRDRRNTWGRKDEEYIADFSLIAKRYLTDSDRQIFRYHFLLGADWKLCCRKTTLDRGEFFHIVYRIQQRLGRVFRELEPYGLYPLSEYFNGESKAVTAFMPQRNVVPLRPPVRRDTRLPGTKAA